MKKTHKAWSWLVPAVAVLCLSGWPMVEGSEPGDAILETNRDLETELITQLTGDAELAASLGAVDVVRQLYGNAQDLLTGSGHDVSIEVEDLVTLDVDQFEHHPWADMVTAKGARLQIEKVFLSVEDAEPLLHIRAEWQADGNELPQKGAVASPEGFKVGETAAVPTVAEIEALFDTLDADPLPSKPADGHAASRAPRESMETLALSTYSVVLQAEGISRSYRAAMFWRQREGGELTLNIQDNVLTPVESIAFETAETTPHPSFEALFEARPDLRSGPLPSSASSAGPLAQKMDCLTTVDNNLSTLHSMSGAQQHQDGQHKASMKVSFEKTCNGGCAATCEPSFQVTGCTDSGRLHVVTAVHKPSSAYKLIFTSDHLSATCGAAVQCAFKQCTIGFCGGGISLGISWNGAGFSFSGPSNTLATYNLEETATASCLQLPDDPPGPPCGNTRTGVSMLAFEDDAPSLSLAADTFELTRSEPSNMKHHGEPVTYVMGEWALVDVTAPDAAGRPAVSLRKTSSAAFGLAKSEPIHEALKLLPGQMPGQGEARAKTILIVEHPTHEDNSRAIPMPELQLATIELGPSDPLSSDAGSPRRIMVRADFGEQRQLQGFDVIHDPVGLGEHQLQQIREGLSLQYQNDDSHRVIVFAVLELGERVEIERTLSYLPKCCCTGEICV